MINFVKTLTVISVCLLPLLMMSMDSLPNSIWQNNNAAEQKNTVAFEGELIYLFAHERLKVAKSRKLKGYNNLFCFLLFRICFMLSALCCALF